MDIQVLERIVTEVQSIAAEAVEKREKFKKKGNRDLFEQSMGELVGIGKVMQVLTKEFPDEINALTNPE